MIGLLFVFFAAVFCDRRLIDFGPGTEPKWMTQSEVEDLMNKPIHNFMDITDFQNDTLYQLPLQKMSAFPSQPTHKDLVHALIGELSTDNLKKYNDKLTSFFNRYYTTQTGVEAADFIYAELLEHAKNNPTASVSQIKHTFLQPSVIARIQGSGPRANEIVILGCHEDSTAGGAARRSPGSDDDGSGSMTNLEIFRLLMQTSKKLKFDRSVEIHFYAAEEAGLLGSQDIATTYKKNGYLVYSMLQLDMTLYPGKTPQFGVVTDFTNPDLTQFLRILVDAYSNLQWVNTRCGYACSDHASWFRAGYASAFPFETTFTNLNPYIHTASDTLDRYSIPHSLEFAKVALAYLIELAAPQESFSRDNE